ncbi:DUF4232 domain-containing protein [Microbacterium sp. K36]|uniref:DUF4232 domain-containing protein n=1 Tax=Microbacterium sp. K36 TaxID=2305439 RepID=UPI00109C604E|nr:DUF4232 domain-containing protein [Microbacterium sp. K36]
MASAPPSTAAVSSARDGRTRPPLTAALLAGLLLGALWIVSGAIARLTGSDIVLTRLLSFVGIGPLQSHAWLLPGAWGVLVLAMTAAVLCSVAWIVGRRAQGVGRAHAFLVLWFGAVLAGTVVGLCDDVTRVLSFLPLSGLHGLTAAVVESAPVTAYWGLAWGWIPAWAFSRRAGEEPARRWSPRLLGVALASMVALVVIGSLADAAWQRQIVEENAALQGTTDESGAFVDPAAVGDPVPDRAPGASTPQLPAGACTPDRATLLLGTADGATGHRAQSIRLMNVGEEPCVVEGYPDIAFADQNGHALDVEVRPGSSFLATDPGSAPVTVPPQGEATAVIGWDAHATDGALVARALHAAVLPGYDRGSWPVELDIVSGSEVEITAWHLGAAPAAP